MRIAMLVVSLLTLFLAPGCTAIDEGCTADAQCRFGRICVEGRCEGALQGSNNENNSANNENNFNNENNSANNEFNNENNSENNEFNNVANNENNVQNNFNNENNFNGDPFNNEFFCGGADDCPDDLVCTGNFEEDLVCEEPWSCRPTERFIEPEFCEVQYFCEDEDFFGFLICEFGDEDRGVCFCEGEDFAIDFEAPRGICGNEAEFADLINTTCGWRLPRN